MAQNALQSGIHAGAARWRSYDGTYVSMLERAHSAVLDSHTDQGTPAHAQLIHAAPTRAEPRPLAGQQLIHRNVREGFQVSGRQK